MMMNSNDQNTNSTLTEKEDEQPSQQDSNQTSNKRTRSQRFNRAKTGCFTCRARRKKCDETKDINTGGCQRCLKSGIECLGFPVLRGAPLAAHSKKQKAAEDERLRLSSQMENDDVPSINVEGNKNCGTGSVGIDGNLNSQDDQIELLDNVQPSSIQNSKQFIPAREGSPFRQFLHLDTPPPNRPAIEDSSTKRSSHATSSNHETSFAPYPFRWDEAVRFSTSRPTTPLLHQPLPWPQNLSIGSHEDLSTMFAGIASPLLQSSVEDWLSSEVMNSLTDSVTSKNASNVVSGYSSPSVPPTPTHSEERDVLRSLAAFYSKFCLSWWLPKNDVKNKRRNLHHVIRAVERRLRNSEIACTTVAVVAACYGFGNHQALFDSSTIDSFRQSWERIYEVICDNKTSSLCAYLDWLGSNTALIKGVDTGEDSPSTASPPSTVDYRNEADQPGSKPHRTRWPWEVFLNSQGAQSLTIKTGTRNRNHLAIPKTSQSAGPIEAQADRLFSFASTVLTKVAMAARQDQCTSNDILVPLEYAALIHVDVYIQASMDLALFAFTSRPEKIFHRELDAAGSLLESLLGRGQSVRLSEIDGVEAVGFRTFAWTDILNSVLLARCTRLHYLFEPTCGDEDGSSDNRISENFAGTKRKDNPSDYENTEPDTEKSHRSRRGISISFGCPDDVLVIFAHTANLHFQLRQARATKAIQGNGAEALPAWALHTACDLARRIEESERMASNVYNNLQSHSTNPTQFEQGQRILASMWRHAAMIFLHTTAYRLGPLGKVNQERMKAILDLWTRSNMEINLIDNGNPAMPILFAAFIAQQKSERNACREALKQIGRHERSRQGYRDFVERLWSKTDEMGFALLWHDLLDSETASEIAIM